MKFEYCNDRCKKECSYPAVNKFINSINMTFKTNYQLIGCPDQAKENYTCDLMYKDQEQESIIYVEVKRVKFGFGSVDKQNSFLGSHNGQSKCEELLIQTFNKMVDKYKIKFLNDFEVHIPLAQLDNNEISEFQKTLEDFFENLVVDNECDEYCCIYKRRRGEEIKIPFKRKTQTTKEKFGDKLIYAYETESDNVLSSIFAKMTDVEFLKKLVRDNFAETSAKKFPEDENPKILLNVLEIPRGYGIFFLNKVNYVVGELLNIQYEYPLETAATEGYLLYYCNECYTVNEENVLNIQDGNSLIIVPIIKGMFNDVTMYSEIQQVFDYASDN